MSESKSTLTQEGLKELLAYDAESGVFTWRLDASTKRKAGSVAGCLAPTGYVVIRIPGDRLHAAHRLAWLYVHGQMPSEDVDHVDGRKAHNAIRNLRLAPQVLNQQNRKAARVDNKAGLLGVCLDKRTGRWRAEIKANKVRKFLGRFQTKEEACAAYLSAKRELHPFGTL